MTINQLMINYALMNNLREVTRLIHNGADVDYNGEQLLQISVFMGFIKMTKLALKLSKCETLDVLIDTAERMGHTKILGMLQDRRISKPVSKL